MKEGEIITPCRQMSILESTWLACNSVIMAPILLRCDECSYNNRLRSVWDQYLVRLALDLICPRTRRRGGPVEVSKNPVPNQRSDQRRIQFLESVLYGTLVAIMIWPLLGFPQMNMANQPAGMAIGAHCANDIAQFCSNVRRGRPQNPTDMSPTMMSCLTEHKKQLSPNCLAAIEAKKKVRNAMSPCSAEIQRFCANEDFGQMRMFVCLNSQKKEDLSPTCLAHLEQRMKEGRPSQGGGRRAGSPGAKPTGSPSTGPN
jgi:hypothetical protein